MIARSRVALPGMLLGEDVAAVRVHRDVELTPALTAGAGRPCQAQAGAADGQIKTATCISAAVQSIQRTRPRSRDHLGRSRKRPAPKSSRYMARQRRTKSASSWALRSDTAQNAILPSVQRRTL